MTHPTRTAAELLDRALATDPARPFITFYDDATGERVELSVATFANWVAKTANYLQDELAVEPGDRVALLLPAHWQTAVWVAACFATGTVAAPLADPAGADLVVSGPETLDAARACRGERVALALRPLGGRFPQAPEGFRDYAVEVPGQGDHFVPYVAVDPAGPALEPVGGDPLTGGEVAARAAESAAALGLAPGARVLTGRPPHDWDGLAAGLLAPLAAGASVVLCRHLGELPADRLAHRTSTERVTHTVS
jgi:uncharacterized protein (TIGR03089 family)